MYPSADPSRRWFAVHTLTNDERRAIANLARQGFPTFIPWRLRTVRHARRLSTVTSPFFPGYLFLELDLSRDRWRSVNSTYGVASLVMHGDRPAPLPAGVVEALIQFCDERGFLRLDRQLEVGQRVRVLSGPFADWLGRLTRLDDRGRVQVLLDLLGRVELDARGIMPAA